MISFNTAASALVFLASCSLTQASYEYIAHYEPLSQVTDHNAIDLDQEAIERQLSLANDDAYAVAFRIYSKGAYSKSVAVVDLDNALPVAVEKGTTIMGLRADGNQVAGKAYDDYAAGVTSIMVQYKTSDRQDDYVECQVGASITPNTEGCFVASGSFTIDGTTEISYTYNPLENNVANRTIQDFSTSAQKKMGECDNCPYPMYEKFLNYYGEYDYAHQIVFAAFSGTRTQLKNFNNDFGLLGYAGQEQIIKKGTVYMSIWMYVIREMEDALDDCQEACTIQDCNDAPVHAWDEAVAFYTGSLEGTDGSGSGKLMYALADKRCVNFKTCGDMADRTSGTSKVNIDIFKNFSIGQAKINMGECASARTNKENIEKLMLVPLIQGTLRYAWKVENEAYSEMTEAEGAIFALAVTPVVAACDDAAAQIIASNMEAVQLKPTNFAAVKAAFESTYDCMGIDPTMVGGLYNAATGTYFVGARPAGSSAASVNMVISAGIAALTFMFMFL